VKDPAVTPTGDFLDDADFRGKAVLARRPNRATTKPHRTPAMERAATVAMATFGAHSSPSRRSSSSPTAGFGGARGGTSTATGRVATVEE